jgi:MSHA biogenesis protein MshN
MAFMSVVNKMLSDLEKRSQSSRPNANYVPSKTEDSTNKTVAILLAVLMLLAALLAWLLMREQTPINSSSTSEERLIVKVDENTQLDDSSNKERTQEVVLEGSISSSQLRQTDMLETESDAQVNQKNVDVVLDGESIKELVTRLSDSVEQLQAIKQQSEASEINQIASTPVASNSQTTNSLEATNGPQKVESPVESSMSVASTSAKDSVSGIQQEVNRQLQSGDKAGAIKNLTRVLAIEPRNLSARKKLASLHFGLGNTAIASELLQQGIALAPSDSAMRLMLARLLFRADNPDSALQLLKAHPRSVIADDELLSFRAALAEKQGDYGQAIEDYSQLIDRQQTNARWWLGLAVSQDKQSLRQEAITSYRRAQTLNQLSDQVSTFVKQRLSVLEG